MVTTNIRLRLKRASHERSMTYNKTGLLHCALQQWVSVTSIVFRMSVSGGGGVIDKLGYKISGRHDWS